jgi:hypothetical protein
MERLYLRLWFLAGLLLLVAGLALLAGQCFLWLTDGVWYSCSASDLLRIIDVTPAPVSWPGVQSLIDWALWLPTSIVLLAAAWVVGLVAMRKKDALLRKTSRWAT